MSAPIPEPVMTLDDAARLAKIAGVDDMERVASLHRWFEKETPVLRSTPDLADHLKDDEESAEQELRPLCEVAREFADLICAAPHALERVRMLYAEELSGTLALDLETESRRRLDQDLVGISRFFAAIEAADEQIEFGSHNGPALLGPRKAAERLAKKYKEISLQEYHFDIPVIDFTDDPWTHPHTSAGVKFVAGAIKLMFPNINDTNLKRILKELPQATKNWAAE